jgi:hypothetical protein
VRRKYHGLIGGTILSLVHSKSKSKAVPVTDCGSPQVCGTSRISHFLRNQVTDGGEVISLMRQPRFTRRKIPGAYFC